MKYDPELECYVTREVFILASLSLRPADMVDICEDLVKLWPKTEISHIKAIAKRAIKFGGWQIEPRAKILSSSRKRGELTALWFAPGEYERFMQIWRACRRTRDKITMCTLRKYRL